ncbi:hypothetical protein [Actinomadura sp. 9N407]|uniref:hypothetical protein n=1 Tax=Actinomadura sp. 9N407 TaxID=3375154 RepID=UPI0037B5E6EF
MSAVDDPPALEAEGPSAPERPPGRRWVPTTAAVFTLAVGCFGWIIGLRPLGDNSFLWHLQTGHWILEHGVPRRDLFSFTAPDAPWIAQSWLAEVLYALLDDLAGAAGIKVLNAAVGALVAMLAYRLALRFTRHSAWAAFLTVAAVAASLPFWSGRPLFLGILAMLVLVWIVEVPDSRLGARPALTVPVLMWLWANLHGGYMLGFGYLGLHLLGRLLDGHRPTRGRERSLLLGGVIGFGLCFVNPYGAELVVFPFRLLLRGGMLSHVVEWMSPNFRSAPGMLFGVWIVVFLAALMLARRRLERRDVVVSLPFLLLAFWAQRNIAVAPLVALPVVARVIAVPELRDRGRLLNVPLLGVLLLGVAQLTVGRLQEPGYQLERHYPVKAMRALEQRGLLGRRLLTTDGWGGYVIHAYWPRQRVFIDDRYDMYPDAIAREHLTLIEGGAGWDAILDRRRIEVVLWPKDLPLTQLVGSDPAWRPVYTNAGAVIYTRR